MVKSRRNRVAIRKNYLSTYGWEVDDAYYKVDDDYHKLPDDQTPKNDDGTLKNYWVFTVNVFRNEAARTLNNHPLAQNVMKIEVPDDVATDDLNAMKTECYNQLKVLTNSFINDGADV